MYVIIDLSPLLNFHFLTCKSKALLLHQSGQGPPFVLFLFKDNYIKQNFIAGVFEFESGQDIYVNNSCPCAFDSRHFTSCFSYLHGTNVFVLGTKVLPK